MYIYNSSYVIFIYSFQLYDESYCDEAGSLLTYLCLSQGQVDPILLALVLPLHPQRQTVLMWSIWGPGLCPHSLGSSE